MKCPYCESYDWIKNGTYWTGYSQIQKYKCKGCEKWFIENEFKGQKKPDAKDKIIPLWKEGNSHRKIAKLLGLAKRTVDQQIKKYKLEQLEKEVEISDEQLDQDSLFDDLNSK